MKSLFEASEIEEIKQRIAHLLPDSERQWGTMTPAQALAHCSASMRMASGEIRPSGKLMGRIVGKIIKPLVLKDNQPMRRNSPTAQNLLIADQREFEPERTQLLGLVELFAATGPAGCTDYPHSFFGRLTPNEWAVLMYKHLDHHLRQFGV